MWLIYMQASAQLVRFTKCMHAMTLSNASEQDVMHFCHGWSKGGLLSGIGQQLACGHSICMLWMAPMPFQTYCQMHISATLIQQLLH